MSRLTIRLRWRVLIVLVAAVRPRPRSGQRRRQITPSAPHHHNQRGSRPVVNRLRSPDLPPAGELCGLLSLPLTEESALQVNLGGETIRLPIYPGARRTRTMRASRGGIVSPARRLRSGSRP